MKHLDLTRGYVREGLADARQSIWALRSQDSCETTLPVRLRRMVESEGGHGLEASFSLFGAYRPMPPGHGAGVSARCPGSHPQCEEARRGAEFICSVGVWAGGDCAGCAGRRTGLCDRLEAGIHLRPLWIDGNERASSGYWRDGWRFTANREWERRSGCARQRHERSRESAKEQS